MTTCLTFTTIEDHEFVKLLQQKQFCYPIVPLEANSQSFEPKFFNLSAMNFVPGQIKRLIVGRENHMEAN